MSKGRVKWFSPEKGFGFIVDDRAREIFVHYSEILGEGFRMLHDGEEVEYEISDTKRGLQAKKVVRLGVSNGEAGRNGH